MVLVIQCYIYLTWSIWKKEGHILSDCFEDSVASGRIKALWHGLLWTCGIRHGYMSTSIKYGLELKSPISRWATWVTSYSYKEFISMARLDQVRSYIPRFGLRTGFFLFWSWWLFVRLRICRNCSSFRVWCATGPSKTCNRKNRNHWDDFEVIHQMIAGQKIWEQFPSCHIHWTRVLTRLQRLSDADVGMVLQPMPHHEPPMALMAAMSRSAFGGFRRRCLLWPGASCNCRQNLGANSNPIPIQFLSP